LNQTRSDLNSDYSDRLLAAQRTTMPPEKHRIRTGQSLAASALFPLSVLSRFYLKNGASWRTGGPGDPAYQRRVGILTRIGYRPATQFTGEIRSELRSRLEMHNAARAGRRRS
jgi:hypothetical protein